MDNMPPIDIELGSRIKGLRGSLKLSIEELAARSGVSRAMISRIERGESSATVVLEPGAYVMACLIPGTDHVPHLMKGMVRQFTVIEGWPLSEIVAGAVNSAISNFGS